MRHGWTSKLCFLLTLAPGLTAATWLEEVAPVITPAERHAYLRLADDDSRRNFEEAFWKERAIDADEYRRRLRFIDNQYGSGQFLSGSNTDRGRMYLSLGAPDEIQRLPSSKLFFPIEIWRYRSAPLVGSAAGFQCLFFQKNGAGEYRLYSPTLDTIRALLNPQSGSRGLFPVNEIVTAADIRNRLSLAPVESDVIEAATGVSRSVKGMGNEDVLAIAIAPREALRRQSHTEVTARIVSQPAASSWRVFQSWQEGVAAVDLEAPLTVRSRIRFTLSWHGTAVERAETTLAFEQPLPVLYRHRLWLTPGEYTLSVAADGREQSVTVTVAARPEASDLLTGDSSPIAASARPFQFGVLALAPGEFGSTALIQVEKPQAIRWKLLRGGHTAWSMETRPEEQMAGGLFVASPPVNQLPAGDYELEARGAGWTRTAPFRVGSGDSTAPVISYNANLTAGGKELSLGRLHAARGETAAARACFTRAYALEPTDAALLSLARLEAAGHDFDSARAKARDVLSRDPKQFEALALMGYIEVELQDYVAAARFYRQAIAVRPEPMLQQALLAVEARKE